MLKYRKENKLMGDENFNVEKEPIDINTQELRNFEEEEK